VFKSCDDTKGEEVVHKDIQGTVHATFYIMYLYKHFYREAGCTPFATSLIADYFPEVSVC